MTPLSSLTYLRPEVAALKKKLDDFIENEVIPAEDEFNQHVSARAGNERWSLDALPPSLPQLQQKAKELGLWNLFIPPRLIPHLPSQGFAPTVTLTYREYGILAESMGRSELGAMACNCSAPGKLLFLLNVRFPNFDMRQSNPLVIFYRYWQHGSFAWIWNSVTKANISSSSFEGANSINVLDDRATSSKQWSYQSRDKTDQEEWSKWRNRVYTYWTKMVVHR